MCIRDSAFADPLSVSDFGQLALRCAPSVAPSTLASIARTESGFEPLSIHDNTTGTSGAPATRALAIQIASKLLGAGHSVDIGIMQINSANFARLGLTLEAAFDPCKSVAAGAAVLAGGYTGGDTHEGQQAALRVALSEYNTGDTQRGFTNGYVHKVELAARGIVPALDAVSYTHLDVYKRQGRFRQQADPLVIADGLHPGAGRVRQFADAERMSHLPLTL